MNKSSCKKKTIKIVLISIVGLAILIGASVYYLFLSRVPQMDGKINLANLSAPVEVIRDQNGIPHISAKNNRDAFYTLGYIMASERLFQMEMSRRLAKGELSEVFGDKALPSDQLFRNLGLKDTALKLINKKKQDNSFDPQMLEESDAFYAGVNHFIETGKMPIEFLIMGLKPRPFSLVDGQSFVGLMGFSFGIAVMTEPLLTKLVERIGADLVEDLRNEKIPMSESRVVHVDNTISEKVSQIITGLQLGFGLFEGSNGWLLSGKKTASGRPMLVNDPHINYSHPGIWFEAHIKTPTFETYGHFLPLIPFPVLSHNKERAWGLTMSLTDDMDIYKENIDLKNKTYLFKGEKRSLNERVEVIKVKKSKDVVLNIFSTHHGPVLDYALSDTTPDKSLSLQWAFYNPINDPLSALYKMGKATNVDEFKSAVALGMAPGLTILYADKENIGQWIFGEVWKKRAGIKTDFILNGENGQDEILGSLSFEEKPHAFNPESGVIISANTRPASYPANLRGDWQPDDRYKTIENTLSRKSKWSVEETMELQALTMNFENKLIIDALLRDIVFKSAEEKKSFEKFTDLLKNWNLSSDKEASAPALYYSWARTIQVSLLKDLTEEEREVFAKVPNGWIFFKRVILNSDSIWWQKFNRSDFFRTTFIQTIRDLEKRLGDNSDNWRWGELHTVEFHHPLGRVKPLNKIFNLGPFPVSGATQEVSNQKVTSFIGDFDVKAGPSTRRIIDFAHPEKSWGILPAGNSGHVSSPFYKDQVERFLEGKYRVELLEPSSENIYSKMIFTP